MSRRRVWAYIADASGHRHGTMECSTCRLPITDGPYRVRETEEAYITHHRACSATAPGWAAFDALAAAHEVFS